jgi:hypothetical protein
MARSLSTALVVTALFLESIVNGVYRGAGRELPDSISALGALFLVVSLYAWFWSYSRALGIAWPMDLGWVLLLAWQVALPYYIVRAEGRAGWGRIALFCFTYFAAMMTGWAAALWTQVLLG